MKRTELVPKNLLTLKPIRGSKFHGLLTEFRTLRDSTFLNLVKHEQVSRGEAVFLTRVALINSLLSFQAVYTLFLAFLAWILLKPGLQLSTQWLTLTLEFSAAVMLPLLLSSSQWFFASIIFPNWFPYFFWVWSAIAATTLALTPLFWVYFVFPVFSVHHWPGSLFTALLLICVQYLCWRHLNFQKWERLNKIDALQAELNYFERGEYISMSARRNFVEIHTTKHTFSKRVSFSRAIELIGSKRGQLVHRSHWVAIDQIVKIETFEKGRHVVVMSNGKTFPVAASRLAQLKELLHQSNKKRKRALVRDET